MIIDILYAMEQSIHTFEQKHPKDVARLCEYVNTGLRSSDSECVDRLIQIKDGTVISLCDASEYRFSIKRMEEAIRFNNYSKLKNIISHSITRAFDITLFSHEEYFGSDQHIGWGEIKLETRRWETFYIRFHIIATPIIHDPKTILKTTIEDLQELSSCLDGKNKIKLILSIENLEKLTNILK